MRDFEVRWSAERFDIVPPLSIDECLQTFGTAPAVLQRWVRGETLAEFGVSHSQEIREAVSLVLGAIMWGAACTSLRAISAE
ncbi:hypothetical protein [Ensifer canadensis]